MRHDKSRTMTANFVNNSLLLRATLSVVIVTLLAIGTKAQSGYIYPNGGTNVWQDMMIQTSRHNIEMLRTMANNALGASIAKKAGERQTRTVSRAGSRKLSDKVKSGAAGRGATRGGASSRRGTTRFVSTAAPLAPARLAAELGRTPAERLQVERALAAMLATSKQMMERAGLAVDDVASGAQYAVLVGYRVRDEQEWEEVVGRADVRQALVRAAERARELSDAEDVEKQEEFERSVLVASVALGSYEEGRRRGDERMVEQAKRLAEATLARWTR